MIKPAFILLLVLISAARSVSAQSAPGQVLRSAILSADKGSHTIPVDIPASSPAATFTLEIASPGNLDLDLRVSEADADGRTGAQLCASDGIGPIETCTIKRPASGRVTVDIRPFERTGSTEYVLRMTLSTEDTLGVKLGGRLLVDGDIVEIGSETREYQVSLRQGQAAVLRLAGRSRQFSASDSANPKQSIPARSVGGLQQQIVLGAPLENSRSVFRGVGSASTYSVFVGGVVDKFSSSVSSILSMVLAPSEGREEYVIPFESTQVEVFATDRNSFQIKRRIERDPAVFLVPDTLLGGIARVLPAEFDIAFCDEYGRVINISDAEVRLGDDRASRPSRQEKQARFGNDLYVVVFRSPFSDSAKATTFELRIEGPGLYRQEKK